MTNFKISGGPSKGLAKSHYIVLREHEKKDEQRIDRLTAKLDKHMNLPMDKAHPESPKDQKSAPLPNMRK